MHISRPNRQQLSLPSTLFTAEGRLLFPEVAAARPLAQRLHRPAAELYALSWMSEFFRLLLRYWRMRGQFPLESALQGVGERLGAEGVERTLADFVQLFPPSAVFDGLQTVQEYLRIAGHPAVLEEMLLLYLENANPAAEPLRPLFDDTPLRTQTAYEQLINGLQVLAAGGGGENPFDLLLAPFHHAPHSLQAQLQYLLQTWDFLLDETWRERFLRALDFLREEEQRFAAGPGPAPILDFSAAAAEETQRFSPDREWMPRLVLIAKNTYVWLAQLSRAYGRPISRLDEIPDAELERLARWGINGLWLIGLWERSRASQRIKQLMGDRDAVASAYALYSYEIAADLGGWEALETLQRRAAKWGIRLAADMVPNHMGIDSQWVIEHPEWFISLPYPPYPSYTFTGPDLSDDPRVGIYLEDHYYTRSDAAVVFQRVDRHSGAVRYIYHGNDGTSLPWNDTAQLDYLNPETRQMVLETILRVARHFPIIRFDAAMTLVKRHIQRLWYPLPGQGGAIPSRAEHSLPANEFEARLPREFWREVVDRIAEEAPDTLLLAEAFWMMEGYFVRTLGMHRVYNSAFMHMLRDEDNAKYRQVMKNVLEFEPQILKRFVNFMNNPDEKTAIEQFGSEGKYFGVCTLMVTLPGLPMFGHGQIEGYREKYGMEFRSPRWDEMPNAELVAAHERFIFPLLQRRALFAEVENFVLYDFFTLEGVVNEDVFAFSNRQGEERALVVYHNRYAETRGWIRLSVAQRTSTGIQQLSLAEALALPHQGYVRFRDAVNGLEYLRSCAELWEQGLFLELEAYQRHVFLDWHVVDDTYWAMLHRVLSGRAVVSLDERYQALANPITQPLPPVKPPKPASPKKKSSPGKGRRRKSAKRD